MDNLIQLYIDSKRYAWSATTVRSESYRLKSVAKLLNGDANLLWESIQHLKVYARLTLWTRVTQYFEWLIEEGHINGPNPYKKWRQKNAKQFKNAYTKNVPTVTFEEAVQRISTIRREDIRRRAFELLGSGLRYSEAGKSSNGQVVGKGNKTRNIYKPEVAGPDYQKSYETFRRELSRVGLKPHDLRKLALSRLVELGANEFELCEIAGWSNINTASSYIKTNQSKVRGLMERLQGDL